MQKLRVALVYDRVNKYGGAERVLLFLHSLFPDAPLYTSVYDARGASWAQTWKVIPSWLQRIPLLRSHHEWLGPLMPLAFESFDFSHYDLVISVTSEAAKGIVTKPGTQHICYLLTPTRYLWSHADEYRSSFSHGWKRVLLPLYDICISYLRNWDLVASQRPDIMIPISDVVRKRCERYYLRSTEPVIYPPIRADLFSLQPTQIHPPFSSYFLCVSRLVPYKRIDLAIRACRDSGRNLIIVGTGSDERILRKLAGYSTSIYFTGHLTDQQLVGYYQQCTGLIFPGEEDFGLTVLEAMACGKPSIVFEKSGNAEVVDHGVTGIIVSEQKKESLVRAMQMIESIQWDSRLLRHHALRFTQEPTREYWRKYL